MKIKYFLSHPIQYQTPLINYLVKMGLDIQVCYKTKFSKKKFFDNEFKKNISWNINLTKGHNSIELDGFFKNNVNNVLPITTSFYKKIFDDDREIFVFHGNKNWYNLILIFVSFFFKKKIFLRDEIHKFSSERTIINKFLNKIFYFIINPFVDIFLAIGKANKEYYISNYINKKKIILAPYAVNNEFFKYKKKNVNKKKRIFLTVAKFHERKSYNVLLDAILKLDSKYKKKDYEFWLVGDGVTKKKSKEFVKQNRIKNIKFFNFKNQIQIRKFYKNSDIFILPSKHEAWGLVINEAMSSSNAILCSDKVGASYNLVKNGINGYTFKTGNSLDLSKKISLLLKTKKLNSFQKQSFKIISKWNFQAYFNGFKSAINRVK